MTNLLNLTHTTAKLSASYDAAPAPSVRITGERPQHSEKERRWLGDIPDAAPHAGLAQGRTSDAKPASILRAGGQGNVSPETRAYLAAEEPSIGVTETPIGPGESPKAAQGWRKG